MERSQRENNRIYLTFYLRIFENLNFLGFLVDISKTGLMIISETQMEPGKKHRLRMKLPPDMNRKYSEFIEFTAECRWSNPDEENSNFFLTGFEMTAFDDLVNDSIEQLIRNYKLP